MGRSATEGLTMLMRCACAPSRTPAPTRPPCTRAAVAPPAPPAPPPATARASNVLTARVGAAAFAALASSSSWKVLGTSGRGHASAALGSASRTTRSCSKSSVRRSSRRFLALASSRCTCASAAASCSSLDIHVSLEACRK
eukprot:scaffold65463_cov63-Phaeocystis_antarctica.AAC.2